MPDLSVKVHSNKARYVYGETVALTVKVTNTAKSTLYVVTTPLFAQRGGVIHVRLGEAALPEGVLYYAFTPRLRALAPKKTAIFRIRIGTPLHQPEIVGGIYGEVEQPYLSGQVRISVVVGYLNAPFRRQSMDPWQELVSKQILSPPVTAAVDMRKR